MIKEKGDKKEDDLNFDLEDIKSIATQNLPAPESVNISGIGIPSSGNPNNKQNELKKNNIDVDDDQKEQEKEENPEDKKENNKKSQKKLNKKLTSELRTNSMPHNSSSKLKSDILVKKEVKKSYTQKDNPIRAYIKKRELLDTHPDISNIEDYITLTDLVEDEKALKDIIPDFKEKILDKESKADINNREFNLIKHKTLPEDIRADEQISQNLGELPASHPEIMKEIYEKKGIPNIQEYKNDEIENAIFGEEMEDINCPIGGVEDLDSFLQKYFLNENLDIKGLCKRYFAKWRRILCDGNSFYRIIMFSIFEAYILSNNLQELKYLLSEITSDEYIAIYKEKKIDYETCFSIFSIILNYLEKKQNVKAYEILLKSYLLKDNKFDKLLITYLRRLISIYVNELKNKINENNPEKFNEICNKNKFNTYLIENTNIEPTFLILCIIQYLFNINMIFLCLKGELSKPIQNQINFVDEENYPIIYIGFFFSSYYKLYPQDFEEKYNYKFNLIENNNKQLTFIFKDPKPCKKCAEDTEHIFFVEKKFIICKKCLEDHLSYACNFRADAFKEDGFIGLEYYTRPIYLCHNYYIDDLEIMELLESLNLINAFCQKYNSIICNKCKEKSEEKEYFEFKCGCTFCDECNEKNIKTLTNGYKYLCPIEKKEFETIKCLCGKIFDLEEALKHIKYTQNDMKEASIRLKSYINTLCLICTGELRIEDHEHPGNYKTIKKYKIIKLKKNMKNERSNGIDYMEIEHLMCEDCYSKHLKGKSSPTLDDIEEEEEDDDHEQDKEKKVDLDKGTIKCEICCRKHDLDPKFSNDGGCCTACIVF